MNAERRKAVDMMLNKEKYEAAAALREANAAKKKDGKGDKGGKKKK